MKTKLRVMFTLGSALLTGFASAQNDKPVAAPAPTPPVAAPAPSVPTSPFIWNAQYMSRGEYRHGYSSLADSNQAGAAFISQRARLGAIYKTEKYKIGVAVQDIRTWGATPSAPIDLGGNLSLFEGWGELNFTSKLSAKVGRQAIAYDEERIFGAVDWGMQGRRHDAAILKYSNDSVLSVHVGGAYNQDKDQLKGTIYTVPANYKSFQYAYLYRAMPKLTASFLFLNNGVEFTYNDVLTKPHYATKWSQTFGPRITYKSGNLSAAAYYYHQVGIDGNTRHVTTDLTSGARSISAYDASAEVSYKVIKPLGLTLGGELLSGTSQDPTKWSVNRSFTPFYGTNHRFNGYMDYFYAGNHINSVGLQDIYFKVNYEYKKILTSINVHNFSAAADINDKDAVVAFNKANPTKPTKFIAMGNKALGNEVDLTVSYNVFEGVAIQGGYSRMFGTKGMQYIKGLTGNKLGVVSDWGYVMLLIRPGAVKWPKTGVKM